MSPNSHGATEYQLTGREREVLLLMGTVEVMKASVELGLSENKSRSGLTGGTRPN